MYQIGKKCLRDFYREWIKSSDPNTDMKSSIKYGSYNKTVITVIGYIGSVPNITTEISSFIFSTETTLFYLA